MPYPPCQAMIAFLNSKVDEDLAKNKTVTEIISSTIEPRCKTDATYGISVLDISSSLLVLSEVYQSIPELRSAIAQLGSHYAQRAEAHARHNMTLASSFSAVPKPPTVVPVDDSHLWRKQVSNNQLQTKEDFCNFLHDFAKNDLGGFRGINKEVDAISDRAARWRKEGTGLASPTRDSEGWDLVSGVAKISFYDFIFLCGMWVTFGYSKKPRS